jgi:2-dehydro-3-deoxygalactonokinase
MIAEVQPEGAPSPVCIAAAGMITSPQGLCEVPHVEAPAGVEELARAAIVRSFDDVTPLPFLLVPGVRTRTRPGGGDGIGAGDVMRGEETLCAGLLRRERLHAGGALLNLGSHWKLVRLDERGRVAWSITSLSGEMMHAVRTQTILASGLPDGAPAAIDGAAFRDGMDEALRSGLPRALFCLRLLELFGARGPEERLSFLIGAFVATDFAQLRANGALPAGTPVAICGGEKIGGAWTLALEGEGYPVRVQSPGDVEGGLLAGLQAVAEARA